MTLSGVRQCYGLPSCPEEAASIRAEWEASIRRLVTRKAHPLVEELAALAEVELQGCDPSDVEYYNEYVKVDEETCVNMCIRTIAQSNCDEWHEYRKCRFGGSNCYDSHTYFRNRNPDWDNRFKTVFMNNFSGDDNTIYGLKNESKARDKSSRKMGREVFEIGLLVKHLVPWISHSPDGIIFDDNGDPAILDEYKCPVEGKRLTCDELLSMKAVKSLDQNNNLRVRHKHNGQVQLGMLLLNIQRSHYIIYSSLEDDIYVCPVQFDEVFTREMCSNLCKVYFREILPRLAEVQRSQE